MFINALHTLTAVIVTEHSKVYRLVDEQTKAQREYMPSFEWVVGADGEVVQSQLCSVPGYPDLK